MRNLLLFPLIGFGFIVGMTSPLHGNQNYLGVYLERNEGLDLEKKNDYLGALVRFKVDLAFLEKVHEREPEWQHYLVMKAITDYREKVETLEPLALKQVSDRTKAPLSWGPGPADSLLYDEGLKEPDTWKAMNEIEEYLTTLEIMHQTDPQWESERIEDRIKSSKGEMDRLAILTIKTEIEKPYDDLPAQ